MTPVSDKVEVVHQYEVGMSKYFIEQNIPVVGVFEPTWNDLMLAAARAFETGWWRPDFNARIINLDLEVARTLNPTHFLWDRVLEQFSIIKVDILRRGHPRGLNLLRFESAMRDSPALADLIRDATGE